jgi:hypothetical protein
MAAPPDDISAAELYLKLSESKPSEVFDFPNAKGIRTALRRVRIQVLSMKEHEQARVMAHRRLKEAYKLKEEDMTGITMREVAGDAVARELLAIACRYEKPMHGTEDNADGPSYPRMFRDAEHVGQLTANEVLVLFNAYLLTQEKYGPFERGINSQEDVDKWIKRIEEGGSEFPLLSLSLPQLVQLTSLLGGRVSSLYRILATQWGSLPDSLRSALQSFSEGILSFGSAPEDTIETGLESSPEDVMFASEQPLTIEDAKALAQKLRNPSGA